MSRLLGVTRQRVHQLVPGLLARGLIRCADQTCPTYAIALKDDKAVLLPLAQERVLSAFPNGFATTLSCIAAAVGRPRGTVAAIIRSLCKAGLIKVVSATTQGDLYQLTPAGSTHWQRTVSVRQAAAPPPPFRSDRVRDVLLHLDRHGPTRTRDIGLELDVPKQSMNALMQYLKRRKAVCTQTDTRFAPYELTRSGREMLEAMIRARAEPEGAVGVPEQIPAAARRQFSAAA